MLDGQLRLLETKRGEVRTLRERGGSSSCVEALANDLVGIRIMLSAALLAGEIGETERQGLEQSESEARELLGEARALASIGRGARIAPKPRQRPV